MQNIEIDQEFQSLIPQLSLDERQQLEANIKSDGCRDPLVMWNGILIDGHNRYEICSRLGISFTTVEKQFNDRSYVVEWIIKNQFGRRNLNDFQRGELALRMKPIIEARALERKRGGQGGILLSEKSHEAKKRTDEVLGEMAGLSSNTIRKVESLN